MDGAISIDQAVARLEGPFRPMDLVEVNDAVVRIAIVQGEFPWHHHEQDELFLCWDGSLRIEMEDREAVELGRGDLVAVPRGVEHRPVAPERAVVIMLEQPETKQYGD